MKNLLLTGAAGFIASHCADQLLAQGYRVIAVDKLGYASNMANLTSALAHPQFTFQALDINETEALFALLQRYEIDCVLNLAGETHVDNSIHDPFPFLQSNVQALASLLEACRRYMQIQPALRLLHMSTDEVFGSVAQNVQPCDERSVYAPSSPYSASKAGADQLLHAWAKTYGIKANIVFACNNFGPRQHREKFIPTVITRALAQQPIPIYGDGSQQRMWLPVQECVRALILILERGAPGENYCIASMHTLENKQLAQRLCAKLDERFPEHAPHERFLTFTVDRPGHDWRYAMAADKLAALGFTPAADIDTCLEQTIAYYLEPAGKATPDDLATCELDAESFTTLATLPDCPDYARVGFTQQSRAHHVDAIVSDIKDKLENFAQPKPRLLDIGCGASALTEQLHAEIFTRGGHVLANDLPAMLAHLPAHPQRDCVAGDFLQALPDIQSQQAGFDYIICYSVLQYVNSTSQRRAWLKAIVTLLKPGGIALLGDLPNRSKRRRYFQSEAGRAAHQHYCQQHDLPADTPVAPGHNQLDDIEITAMLALLRDQGSEAYLLAQPESLYFHSRREDIVVKACV